MISIIFEQAIHPFSNLIRAVQCNFLTNILDLVYYPPTKSEGYSFGVVRPSVRQSIPSVRPHFLSVRNHISVPIGQI